MTELKEIVIYSAVSDKIMADDLEAIGKLSQLEKLTIQYLTQPVPLLPASIKFIKLVNLPPETDASFFDNLKLLPQIEEIEIHTPMKELFELLPTVKKISLLSSYKPGMPIWRPIFWTAAQLQNLSGSNLTHLFIDLCEPLPLHILPSTLRKLKINYFVVFYIANFAIYEAKKEMNRTLLNNIINHFLSYGLLAEVTINEELFFLPNLELDEQKNTCLFKAIQVGDVDRFMKFVALGANVNKQNESGDTPLHIACIEFNKFPARQDIYLRIIYKLIEQGAHLHLKNGDDCIPFEYLTKKHFEQIWHALKQKHVNAVENFINNYPAEFSAITTNPNISLPAQTQPFLHTLISHSPEQKRGHKRKSSDEANLGI